MKGRFALALGLVLWGVSYALPPYEELYIGNYESVDIRQHTKFYGQFVTVACFETSGKHFLLPEEYKTSGWSLSFLSFQPPGVKSQGPDPAYEPQARKVGEAVLADLYKRTKAP